VSEPSVPRRRLGFELVLVALLSFAFLAPGLNRYSLVDPWETHYSEVGRRMLQDNDWVHTTWQKEGFASKPVLTFWLIAASMKSYDIAGDGGYSGELVDNQQLLGAVRMPFVLFGTMGLVMIWLMLARLISRRSAWLSVAIVGSTPFYALVARQAITDMTLVGCMMGAVATFALAMEDGEQPIAELARFGRRRRWHFNALHLWLVVVGGFLLWQVIYNFYYFFTKPALAPGLKFPVPYIVIPSLIIICVVAMWSVPYRGVVGELTDGKPSRWRIAAGMHRLHNMRQVHLLWCYSFLGISILGKGPAALGIFGIVGFFYVLILNRWGQLLDGRFELKRGLFLLLALTVPWHLGMYLKEGLRFLQEYFITHLLQRAAKGVDNETGTFNYCLSQIGYGMYLWAALIPAAFMSMVKIKSATARERTQLLVVIWAVSTFAFFSLIQTKFHHYILPAVPALGIMVAFFLDDIWALRVRISPVFALIAIAIVLLLTRDMMYEEKQWIEMFVFRYDRPWPSAAPWSIDSSDGFLLLGLVSASAIGLLAYAGHRRGRSVAVLGVIAAGLAIGLWAMHAYMPVAGKHWGMREAARTYYEQRQIYGERIVYFGAGQAYDDWSDDLASKQITRSFRSMVPDHLQVGQPMTMRLQINSADPAKERTMESEVSVPAVVTAIDGHTITVTITERTALTDFVARGKSPKAARADRNPIRAVDADRLVIWQGYWRGEVFWSGDEISGWLPEMQTDWQMGDSDSKKMLKFLNDPTLAPVGRRYFVLTSGNISGLSGLLPTARARATLETLNTESNKFQLGAFNL
jgi:4-amino-4-deoxy-L-arabinose transferase-like glycosyltransferase